MQCKFNYFVGNSRRSKGIWARGNKVLRGDSVECNYLAVFLHGSSGNHLLCFVFAIWNFNCSSTPSDRDPSRYFLQRKISSGKRSCSCTFSMGICFILLWWDKRWKEKEVDSGRETSTSGYSQSMITKLVVFLDFSHIVGYVWSLKVFKHGFASFEFDNITGKKALNLACMWKISKVILGMSNFAYLICNFMR